MVWLVETVQTVLITHDSFNAFARSFGEVSELNNIQTEWLAGPIISALGKLLATRASGVRS